MRNIELSLVNLSANAREISIKLQKTWHVIIPLPDIISWLLEKSNAENTTQIGPTVFFLESFVTFVNIINCRGVEPYTLTLNRQLVKMTGLTEFVVERT